MFQLPRARSSSKCHHSESPKAEGWINNKEISSHSVLSLFENSMFFQMKTSLRLDLIIKTSMNCMRLIEWLMDQCNWNSNSTLQGLLKVGQLDAGNVKLRNTAKVNIYKSCNFLIFDWSFRKLSSIRDFYAGQVIVRLSTSWVTKSLDFINLQFPFHLWT